MSETMWWASQYLKVQRSMHACSPTSRESILELVRHFFWQESASLVVNESLRCAPGHEIAQDLGLHKGRVYVIFIDFSTSVRHGSNGWDRKRVVCEDFNDTRRLDLLPTTQNVKGSGTTNTAGIHLQMRKNHSILVMRMRRSLK